MAGDGDRGSASVSERGREPRGREPEWLRAERAHDDDPVVADDTLARMFDASADRNADRVAQRSRAESTIAR